MFKNMPGGGQQQFVTNGPTATMIGSQNQQQPPPMLASPNLLQQVQQQNQNATGVQPSSIASAGQGGVGGNAQVWLHCNQIQNWT